MKKHRIISFILTLVIILSTFSTAIFASTGVENNVKEDTIIKSNAITDINDCPSISVDSDILTNQLISGILQNDIDTLSIDTEKAIIIESSSKEIIDAIKSKNAFSIEGIIVDEEEQVDINQYYNFSSTSKYHIAEWAYKTEQITEEEKIDCFCELIISKNFENIDCLEGIFAEIQNYQLNNTISTELEQKIEEVFTPPFSDTNGLTREISNEKTYKSENFAVHYDGNETTEEVAQSVAEYFEEIRTEYIDYGFRTPILQLLKTRYQVYLDPDSNPDAAAACTKTGTLTNTCASYITIYSFDSLTTDVKERIAHEYFHAIQNAYNHQSIMIMDQVIMTGVFVCLKAI